MPVFVILFAIIIVVYVCLYNYCKETKLSTKQKDKIFCIICIIAFTVLLSCVAFFASFLGYKKELLDEEERYKNITIELTYVRDHDYLVKKIEQAKTFNKNLKKEKEIASRGYYFINYYDDKINNISEIPENLLDINNYNY